MVFPLLYNPLMPPTHVIRARRAARKGLLRLGCSAVLFDSTGRQVLLTRRADNGLWCLPGGTMDAGETVSESIVREVYEETGLRVQVKRLTGVYSDPDQLVIYPDGNKVHIVVMNFLVELISGVMSLCSETTDIRYFPIEEALKMQLFHNHDEHIRDTLSRQETTFIK